jgi:hypothetical protein
LSKNALIFIDMSMTMRQYTSLVYCLNE